MKYIILTLFIGLLLGFTLISKKPNINMSKRTFYEHEVNTIDGIPFDLSSLKGKKLLIVNVASQCGLTSQYKELQELYSEYGGENFEILAFPANNFGSQEPGTEKQIKAFCDTQFGVSFTMFEKISVKGKNQHPLYQWLCKEELNNQKTVSVKWNFQKFLIDEEGNWIDYLLPTTSPKSEKIIKWLQN